LKKQHDEFLESLQAVEQAHETGTIEGTRLDVLTDFRCASMNVEDGRAYTGLRNISDDSPVEVEGPSMKFFYQNFGRVLRNEFWFYPNTDMDGYHATIGGPPYSYNKDQWYFQCLVRCLSYDIVGFAEKYGEGDPDREAYMLNLLLEHSAVKAAKDSAGVGMPAQRFIDVYKRCSMCSMFSNDESAKNRLKSNKKAETMQFFRDNLHK